MSQREANQTIRELLSLGTREAARRDALVLQRAQQGAANEVTARLAYTASANVDSNVVIGQALYVVSTGNVDLAQANTLPQANMVALAVEAKSATETVKYQCIGGVVTQSDWSGVTGAASLTPGTHYYLDPDTAGSLTDTEPETGYRYVCGIALSATTFLVWPGAAMAESVGARLVTPEGDFIVTPEGDFISVINAQ